MQFVRSNNPDGFGAKLLYQLSILHTSNFFDFHRPLSTVFGSGDVELNLWTIMRFTFEDELYPEVRGGLLFAELSR